MTVLNIGHFGAAHRALCGARGKPDSAIDLSDGSPLRKAMDKKLPHEQEADTVTLDFDGYSVTYSFDDIMFMSKALSDARAKGNFPRTRAAGSNVRAVVEDFGLLAVLNEARGDAPKAKWPSMPEVARLHVEAAQTISARDKIVAEKSEKSRADDLVKSCLAGVEAESRMYGLVHHAVLTALLKSGSDETALAAGKKVLQTIQKLEALIQKMADKDAHCVTDQQLETILEDVYGMIDFALTQNTKEFSGRIKHMDGQIRDMNGQFNRVDGQIDDMRGEIMHLNAIGQHVNAIDGHVHSLGNNLNAMGTLLNSTNGNITSMTTQVALLQTIVNMLPRMIAESLEKMLPEALHGAIGPIIALLEAEFGVSLAQIDLASATGRTHKKSFKGFFKGLFKGFRKSRQ